MNGQLANRPTIELARKADSKNVIAKSLARPSSVDAFMHEGHRVSRSYVLFASPVGEAARLRG
jgi:hypothetical protein